MRVETRIRRAAEAPEAARRRAGIGHPGQARQILKDGRDHIAQARRELADMTAAVDAAEAAITDELRAMDAKGR
ncbi:MAG: hypothetical protein VYD87_17165 [Pseudomonadota bacterium]|nr:hypothetical protein [Pseudomonadota bacterium]MEE3101331.1 hypothetical protein [Pseudomonadota bacterium]